MTTIPAAATALRPVVQLLRPRQWIKNTLVFAAPLGAGVVIEPVVFLQSLAAFIGFSAAASAMYVANDLVDADRDGTHPTKRTRPIAAGVVSHQMAVSLTIGLTVTAVVISLLVSTPLLYVVLIYLVVTASYSLRLKQVAVVEIVVVASGFVLRAIAGGAVAQVPISSWFLIVTSFGALFVVAGKRYAELTTLVGGGIEHRPSLVGYSPEYLRHVLTISSGLTAIAYCLWAFEVPRTGLTALLMHLSIIPFVTALLRYSQVIMQGQGGEPEEVFLRDPQLLGLIGTWMLIFGAGVLLG